MQTTSELEVALAPSGFREIGQYELNLDARRGDHVVARSARCAELVAWHHGIFVSKNRVAHMLPGGKICIGNWKAFFAEAKALNPFIRGESIAYQTGVIEYGSADSDESRERSALLAEALAGDAGDAGDARTHKQLYDALGANFHRFATFCRIGRNDDMEACDVCVSRVLRKVPILASSPVHPKIFKSSMFGI